MAESSLFPGPRSLPTQLFLLRPLVPCPPCSSPRMGALSAGCVSFWSRGYSVRLSELALLTPLRSYFFFDVLLFFWASTHSLGPSIHLFPDATHQPGGLRSLVTLGHSGWDRVEMLVLGALSDDTLLATHPSIHAWACPLPSPSTTEASNCAQVGSLPPGAPSLLCLHLLLNKGLSLSHLPMWGRIKDRFLDFKSQEEIFV